MSETSLKGKISELKEFYTDAYGIAVAKGYKGTIEEWLLSLKGDKGEDAVTDKAYNPKSENAQSGIAVAQALETLKTAGGTVVSQNADFAEVAEWADGNPNNEDRTGYFVCANVPVDGIVMKKATSVDDVKGVTILSPAFAGNYTKDKLDSKGNLLPKYSFVAIIGFVPVIDNGACTVGGRCMPDDNGCAIPSSNSMGYQVVNRIDEKRVLIIIEPNGDMVQRIKTKINVMQEDIENLAPDQTYNPESENAQSGKAIAEAVETKSSVIYSTRLDASDISQNWSTITIKITEDEDFDLYNAKKGDICINDKNEIFICTFQQYMLYPPSRHVNSTNWVYVRYIEVDRDYDSSSAHPQSGLAVATAVSDKIEVWQFVHQYNAGDLVIANLYDYETQIVTTAILQCKKNHTSPDMEYPNGVKTFDEYWDIILNISSGGVSKEYVDNAIGQALEGDY